MSRKDDMVRKAAALRERADRLEAQANRRAESPLAEHFPVGVGFGGDQHRPDVHRYAEQIRGVSRLRSQASSLEVTARTTVFSDDLDGLRALVTKHEKTLADLLALKADPDKRAKYGADLIQETITTTRRRLRAASQRLEAAA